MMYGFHDCPPSRMSTVLFGSLQIKEHYHEVLDMLGNCFVHIFDRLNQYWSKEIAIVCKQHPFEPLQVLADIFSLMLL